MNKAEIKNIAESVAEKLKEMPDGTEKTSAQLLSEAGYDWTSLGSSVLMDFHNALVRASEKRKVILDMTKHYGLFEGLPYNLDFVVRNQGQIRCPRCGSYDTGEILYGMPAFNEEVQKRLDSGSLHLGGCCIDTVKTSNGEMIDIDPKYFCNNCKKEIAFPPYLLSEHKTKAEAYIDIVTCVKLTISGYFFGRLEIEIKKNEGGALVTVSSIPPREEIVDERQLTETQWNRIVNRLYNDLYLQEWGKNYKPDEYCMTDGERWSLEITLTGRRKRTYKGDNAYPPYWEETMDLFKKNIKK